MSATKCRRLAMFAALLACAAARADDQAIDPAWRSKVDAGLAELLAKYDEIAPHLEETSETRADRLEGSIGKTSFEPHTRRVHFARRGENYYLEFVRVYDGASSPQIKVECDNPDYFFTLNKPREKGGYVLRDQAPGKRESPLLNQTPAVHMNWASLMRHTLDALRSRSKSYVLKGVRHDPAGGVVWVARSRVESKDGEERLAFDPKHSWRLVTAEGQSRTSSDKEVWTFGVTVGGLEFPSGLTTTGKYKVVEAPCDFRNVSKVTSLKVTRKQPADFRLTAFGIPEPVGAPPPPARRKPWHFWAAGGAAACAALAAAFAYLRRRAARAAASEATP